MTDREVAVATTSRNGLTLQVSCSPMPVALVFAGPVAFGRIGISYRVDNGPVVPRFATMASDGRTAWPNIPRSEIARAKRFRVTAFLPGQESRFYDLDLNGSDALARVKCH